MIIGIDLRTLTTGARTGVEEYTINITRSLVELYPNVEFRLFYNAFRKRPLEFPWLKKENVKLFNSRLPNRPLYLTGRWLGWPKIDKLLGGVDVYFNPHFFWASTARAKQVMTFHDLSFLRYPEFLTRRKRLWHQMLSIRKQAERANRLIAVSESTKADLERYYRIPEEKIAVIYEGIDHRVFFTRGAHEVETFREKYKLPQLFLLFVGMLEPRKNVLGLLEAFERGSKDGGIPYEYHLVLAGGKGWLSHNIFQRIETSPCRNRIHFLTFKPEDRPLLYSAAKIFIFPSFFEGFGLPILEAMACGVPVISSNRSSMSEVAGDAAILVDPYRTEEMVTAIGALLQNESLYAVMRNRGLERAKHFKWERAAEKTFEVLANSV